jgi:hypothetical protein
LACPNPNGSREEDHLPPLESIRHLYKNPDAVVVEHFDQHLKRYPNPARLPVPRRTISFSSRFGAYFGQNLGF